MSAAKAPPGKAMYVAAQADVAWLRSEQQKLHARSHSSREHLWRARCITKGARRVRKGAPGNLPAETGKAPGAHLTPPRIACL
jgi:hypothetical protein